MKVEKKQQQLTKYMYESTPAFQQNMATSPRCKPMDGSNKDIIRIGNRFQLIHDIFRSKPGNRAPDDIVCNAFIYISLAMQQQIGSLAKFSLATYTKLCIFQQMMVVIRFHLNCMKIDLYLQFVYHNRISKCQQIGLAA